MLYNKLLSINIVVRGFIVLLFSLFSINCFSQIEKEIMIKTSITENAIAQNPNLIIEKKFFNKTSIYLSSAYLRQKRISDGSEYSYSLRKCSGMRGEIGLRRYLGKKKYYPNSWFISTGSQYKNFTFHNFWLLDFLGSYKGLAEISIQEYDFILGIGKQFSFTKKGSLNQLKCEIVLSFTEEWAIETTKYIDHIDYLKEGTTEKQTFKDAYILLSINIGYQFRKKTE